jgi:hypothetical protein
MDVLAQNTVVLRYAAHFILTQRAQKRTLFSGKLIDVLAHLQLRAGLPAAAQGYFAPWRY